MRLSRRAFLAALGAGFASACGASASDSPTPQSTRTRRALVPALAADAAGAPSATPAPSPTPQPAWPITIAAVGDVMLARSVATAITADDPAVPFAGVRAVIEEADIALANVECAISSRGAPEPKSYTFQAPPLAARGIAEAGFDAVSLANNHALDYGIDALADTIALLGAEGVAAVGAGNDLAEALTPAMLVHEGVRVAVLGFADVPSEAGYDMRAWEAGPSSPGIAWADPSTVTAAVAEAASATDIVVVMLHFGAEYATEPNEAQRLVARAAIDAGARLVVGHHPHVLQEVEEYGGGLIAYSMGNFVFDGFEGSSNTTAILRVRFAEDVIEDWEMVPATIGWDGLPTLDG